MMVAADAAFGERDPKQIGRWGLSLLVVLAVHGGLALMLLSRQIVPTPAPAPPAVLIELAPLPAAPPPLRPAQEAVPPASAEALPAEPPPLAPPEPEPPLKPEPETAQPPPEPSPAPSPAVTMPAPKPEPPPQPKPKSRPKAQPKPQPVDRPPPQRLAAPAQPAPAQPAPALPAPAPAAIPAAPGPSPAATAAARTNWQGQLLAWLSRHKRYPREAQEQRQQGTAHLRFVVDRYGRVLSSSLARSSGFAALDEEVVALIQRAQPLPPPPPELPGTRFELDVPVSFSLHRN
jgi:protein TonB